MTEEEAKSVRTGDVVQAEPGGNWNACLVIVTEVRSWGVQGFTPIPPDGGQAYIRLTWDQIEATGGRAVFMPAHEGQDQ